MLSAVISLLAAIFRAIPSIEGIARQAFELADKARAAQAAARKADKDAAVDAAIDGVKKDDVAEFVSRAGGKNG